MTIGRPANHQSTLRIKEYVADLVTVARVPTAHLILRKSGEIIPISESEGEDNPPSTEEEIKGLLEES